MKGVGWIVVGATAFGVVLIMGSQGRDSQKLRPLMSSDKGALPLAPKLPGEANLHLDDSVAQGNPTDTCTITVRNNGGVIAKDFRIVSLRYGPIPPQPNHREEAPEIKLEDKTYTIDTGQTVTIQAKAPHFDRDQSHPGWIEYKYSYVDGQGPEQTSGIGHVLGWRLPN